MSGKKFRCTNIVAAKQGNNIISPLQYDCTMTGDLFESWFENFLLPELSENSVLVMDNASFHRKKKLMAERHHVILFFLPPYSPELNPIEKVWANFKHWLNFHLLLFATLDDAISNYFKVN
ncbi:MAG: transposase [Oscillospiraceae bacterium]|nr:transposase [Oscillospiraceae bacterium]